MKALILAGDNTPALRPLTCASPAVMLPVCNAPLISCVVSRLKSLNPDGIIISADKYASRIADYFDGTDIVPLIYFTQNYDGSANAAAKAAESYDVADDDTVLVMSGNVLCDFDFDKLVRKHKYSKSVFTAVLFNSDKAYGGTAAVVDEEGKLEKVCYNMPRESCLSDLLMTEIFVCGGELLKKLNLYGEDIFKDVIPRLITSGINIQAYVIDENAEGKYYREINSPAELYSANEDAVSGVYPFRPCIKEDFGDGVVCKGKNAEISPDAQVSGFAVIGANVSVGSGTKLHDCIIFDNSHIGSRCTINGAIIGKSVRISSGAAVFEGAVIGDEAVISEDAAVYPNVKIWNGKHVEPFACAAADLKYGFSKPIVIDEDGITGETNGGITPQTASVAGSAAASIGRKIGIGCRANDASNALAMAAAAGVMSAGGEVWFFGEVSEPELAHCIRICELSAGCFFDAGISAKIRFFSSDGLPLTRAEEKLIESGLNRGEYRRSDYSRFGAMRNCEAMRELYRGYLLKQRTGFPDGVRVIINTAGKRIADTCEMLVKDINDKNGVPMIFHLSGDGTQVSVYTEEMGYIFHDKLILICCLDRFRQGKNVSLPYNFPMAVDKLAEKYGCKVMRYSGCSDGSAEDKKARRYAAECGFVSDGAELMLTLLGILSERGLTLKEACGELPDFATVNRFVAIDMNRRENMKLLRDICAERQVGSDGVTISDKRGRVLIRPVKTGKGVMMHVESYAAEIAGEICDFYQDILRAKSKK